MRPPLCRFAAFLCLSLLSSSVLRAEDGLDESVADFGRGMKTLAPVLKDKEGALRSAGIGAGAVEGDEEQAKQSPLLPAGGSALAQLRGIPGVFAAGAPDLGDTVALDKDGRPVPKDDEENVRRRIRKIVQEKATPVAQKAYENLLTVVWRTTPAKIAAASPESQVLFTFLRGQLSAENDGKDLARIVYDSDMPPNVLATYTTGSNTIKVGPTFSGLPEGGAYQVTVLDHEWTHKVDDGMDGSSIAKNRFDSLAFDPQSRNPMLRNAAEYLAYTDMGQWLGLL